MRTVFLVLTVILLTIVSSAGQDAVSNLETSGKSTGFDWLKKFEGTWTTGNQGIMKSRAVGKRWMVNELSGQIGGGYTAIQTLGYDAAKKQYTGTWIDSTSSYTWHYTGAVDETGKILTLEAKGADFSNPKKMRRYQDIYEFKSDVEIVVVSKMMNDQGEFKTFQSSTMNKQVQLKPESKTTVVPFLMFTGKAESAIEYYKTVFPDTKVLSITKYKAGENGNEGTVKLAMIEIAGQRIMCIDSPPVHDFDFTPSFSFFVECESENQLDERFEKLAKDGKIMMPVNNYGFSKRFGWTSDKFGVSWQLNLK